MELSRRRYAWLLVAAGLLSISLLGTVIGFNSQPVVLTRPASGDTYVSSADPTTPHGTSAVLRVSVAGAAENVTLLQFDLGGRLRPGDLVVKARIRLTVSSAVAATWPVTVLTPRTLTAWQENTTTFATIPSLGFDSSTATVIGVGGAPAPGTGVWFDVTKQMRRWQSYGGPSNFGTALLMDSNVTAASIAFASRENPNLSHPIVEVTFQPGPRSVYGYAIWGSLAAVGVRDA